MCIYDACVHEYVCLCGCMYVCVFVCVCVCVCVCVACVHARARVGACGVRVFACVCEYVYLCEEFMLMKYHEFLIKAHPLIKLPQTPRIRKKNKANKCPSPINTLSSYKNAGYRVYAQKQST